MLRLKNSCEVQLSLIKFTELRKQLIATRSTENNERQSLIDIFDLRTVKKGQFCVLS